MQAQREQQRITQNLFVAIFIFALIFIAVIIISGDGKNGTRARARERIDTFIDSQVVYEPSVGDTTVSEVKPFLLRMVRTCEQMQVLIFHGDIDSMFVYVRTAGPVAEDTILSGWDLREEYGWSRLIEVCFGIDQNPITAISRENHLGGDTLRFLLGGGERPGILPAEASGHVLCPAEGQPEAGNRLISVPEFAGIDSL